MRLDPIYLRLPSTARAAAMPAAGVSHPVDTVSVSRAPARETGASPTHTDRAGSLLDRALAVVAHAIAPLLPTLACSFLPRFALFGRGGTDTPPRALRKALDGDENAAAAHLAELKTLAHFDDSLVKPYAAAIRATGDAEGCKQALAGLKTHDRPLEVLQAFRAFAETTQKAGQALADLDLAQKTASAARVPLPEVAEHVDELRKFDVGKNDSYYNPSYSDLTPSLTAVMAEPGPRARSKTRKLMLELAKNMGLPKATVQVEAVRPLDGELRDAYLKVLKHHPHDAEALLGVLQDAMARPLPEEEFSRFATLLGVSKQTARADLDLKLAHQASTVVPLDEVISHLARLRSTDPASEERYGTFRDIKVPLEHVLDGPDADSRARNLESLQRLEKAARSLDRADQHRQRLLALKCGAADRSAIQDAWVKILNKHAEDPDSLLRALDVLDDRAHAGTRFESFRTLLDAAGRPGQALADLGLAMDLSTRRSLPLADVTEHLKRLREVDPASKDRYSNHGDLRPALEWILDGGHSAKDRVDLLLSVRNGQAPGVGLPMALELEAIGQDPVTDDARALLKKFGTDATAVEVLKTAKASTRPAEIFHGFRRLAEMTGRLAQGRDDMDECMKAAAKHNCPLDKVVAIGESLRKADPARRDSYGTFNPLTPTLDVLLAGSPTAHDLDTAVDDLLELQGRGRDAASALRHDQALRKTPGPPDERPELRKRYLQVLKKTHSDESVLGALDVAGSTKHPAQTLQRYGELLACTRNEKLALEDLKLCVAQSTKHATTLSEAVQRLVVLRCADPAHREDYASYGDAAPALDWLLTLPADRREAHLEGLAFLLKKGRGDDPALRHEQRLAGLSIPVFEALAGHYRKIVVKHRDNDDHFLAALDAVAKQPDAVEQLDHFRHFVDVSRTPSQAVQDLALLQKTTGHGTDEVADLIERLRAADPQVHASRYTDTPLDPLLATVLASPGERRKLLADQLGRLWLQENDVNSAIRDLGWITGGPLPRRDVRDAVRKLSHLAAHEYDAPDTLHTLYDKLQQNDIAEDRGWIARFFRRRGPYERAIDRLIGGRRIDASQLQIITHLEQGRLTEEPFPKTVKRYEQVLTLDGSEDYYYTRDFVKMSDILATVQKPVGWGNWTPEGKWESYWAIARANQSPTIAASIWRCMAAAPSETESKARQEAFGHLATLCGGDRRATLPVYDALAEELASTDSIAAALPAMERLLQNQAPDVAARTYRVGCSLKSMPPAQQAAAQNILGRAKSGDEVDRLLEAIKKPVAQEDIQVRLDVLGQLTAGASTSVALQGYGWLAQALAPEEYPTLLAPLSGLVSVLLRNGTDLREGQKLLHWMREVHREQKVEHMPIADMLVHVSATLLLNPDVDNARHQLMALEARALKERMGGNGSRIEVGEEEVNVGGIRIPVNRQ